MGWEGFGALAPNRSPALACLERLPFVAAGATECCPACACRAVCGTVYWYRGVLVGMVGWGTACLLGRRSGGRLAYEAGTECVAYLLASLLTSTCVTLTLI
jgi:hypothetical protein